MRERERERERFFEPEIDGELDIYVSARRVLGYNRCRNASGEILVLVTFEEEMITKLRAN